MSLLQFGAKPARPPSSPLASLLTLRSPGRKGQGEALETSPATAARGGPAAAAVEMHVLIGIDPLLNGELLAVLREMGHGDTLALTDGNFPSHYLGPPAIRLDADLTRAGRAVLSVMPLDGYIEAPVRRMQVDGRPADVNEAHAEFRAMVEEVTGAAWPMGSLERFRFYEETRGCVAVIATLERRPYANMILTKGVIGLAGEVVRPERKSTKPRPR